MGCRLGALAADRRAQELWEDAGRLGTGWREERESSGSRILMLRPACAATRERRRPVPAKLVLPGQELCMPSLSNQGFRLPR